MTIVDGQIESLEKLKESLRRSGITRFRSIGEIRRFLRDFESEKKKLPTRVESELEAEIQDMQSAVISHQQACDELRAIVRVELEQQVHKLEAEIRLASERSNRNSFYRALYFLRIKFLSHRASSLRRNLEGVLKKKTSNAENTVTKLKREIADRLANKKELFSERCKESLDELTHTKEVVDVLYTLVAGAIGETSVVNTLHQLSDDYYLINDFSLRFDPPIYNKRENDRIFSIQIDHLLVCRSGVFLLETKNWSKTSVQNLDLRSPVKQVLRTSFALFVLLNSESGLNDLRLEDHHWGAKKIPIRNIIVMINEKPREEFKHVKVLSLKELIGYIQYFDQTFDGEEVKSIFEYLRNRM